MASSDILKCPVCGEKLKLDERSYQCVNSHNFDRSAKGYVNLLLSNKKNSKDPGDNKMMVDSRNRFLSGGYYSGLSNEINRIVCEEAGNGVKIVDAGCGEGYYLDRLQRSVSEKKVESQLTGIDISKEAIKTACRRNQNIAFVIASSFDIPVLTASADILLQLFSPCCDSEFSRVLNDRGILLSVIPGKNHLYGLKKVLYANPYLNDEEEYPLVSFEQVRQTRVQYDITVEGENIRNLLSMTPYFWRTSEQDIARLDKIDILKTPVEFIITVYRKITG